MKRILFALTATIAMLLPAGSPVQAASCNGASHDITLSNGRANPGSGTTGTAITFSVTYADTAGCVPSSVTVTVAGAGTFVLTRSGSNFTAGVTYSKTMTLGAGSHSYSFTATSGSGGGLKAATFAAVRPAAVVISAPTARPPAPTPAPAPIPPPQPAPVPPPVVPAPVPPPVPPATASPTPTATSSATASPTASATPGAPSPTGPEPTQPMLGPLEADRGLWAMSQAGFGASAAGFELPLLGTLVAYLAATAAGLAFFALLVRRRRDTESAPIGMTLATASSSPAFVERRVTPLPPMRELIPPVNPNLLSEGDEPTGPLPDEAGLPRWLRPSVRSGRRTRNPGRLSGRDD